MLFGIDGFLLGFFALRQLGQTLVIVINNRVVFAFFIDRNEPIKDHHLTIGPQHDLFVSAGDVDDRAFQFGGGHLAGHGTFIDQVIKFALIAIGNFGILCADRHFCRADTFVRFLRVLGLVFIDARLIRQIAIAELGFYGVAGLGHRFGCHIDAVCSHVGNQTR